MNRQKLFEEIKKKKSFLCIGLDTDIKKIPKCVKKGLQFDTKIQFEFNRDIVDSTNDLCIGYKLNLAFYEAEGLKGWKSLEDTVKYIRANYPKQLLIADAKRGDIGNTSSLYARAFFEKMDFDAVTVAPYMGEDSVSPFLTYADKWAIVLALTSNKGANDFQHQLLSEWDIRKLYERVLSVSSSWGTNENMMYVIGATQAKEFENVRKYVPDHFLLVPGVGAQGGSLAEVAKYGMNKQCGLLVNSSRQIIYASDGDDFAEKAREEALKVQTEMSILLAEAGLL